MSQQEPERLPIPTPGYLRRQLRLRKPPFWMVSLTAILIVLSWVPLALIARNRVRNSTQPPIHLFHDMDNQPRFKAQQPNFMFADARAMRPAVPGTVARGGLQLDDHLYRGYRLGAEGQGGEPEVEYLEGMPQGVVVDRDFVLRGRQQYQIYCAPCHGTDGYGDGMIALRSQELARQFPGRSLPITPASLHEQRIVEQPDGYLYNVIRNGYNTMAPYGSQIDVEDRWAVVAYVRALQRSQRATRADMPAEDQERLEP